MQERRERQARRKPKNTNIFIELLKHIFRKKRKTDSYIEEKLYDAIKRTRGLPEPTLQHKVYHGKRLLTIPDFAYPELKIAIFCDGYEFHGKESKLITDAAKRNRLAAMGWYVMVFWGRTLIQEPHNAAKIIKEAYQYHDKQKPKKAATKPNPKLTQKTSPKTTQQKPKRTPSANEDSAPPPGMR